MRIGVRWPVLDTERCVLYYVSENADNELRVGHWDCTELRTGPILRFNSNAGQNMLYLYQFPPDTTAKEKARVRRVLIELLRVAGELDPAVKHIRKQEN